MFVRAIEQLENLTMFGLTLPYGFSMSFTGSIKYGGLMFFLGARIAGEEKKAIACKSSS